MASRTIASPGVEINEIDLSLISRPLGATDVLVTGFTDQGPTEDLVNISSISEYEQVYGAPTNGAERYLYHTAKQILLNSPANLLVSRMPYGSGAGEGYSNSYSALVYPIKNAGVGTPIFGITTITLSNSGTGYTTVPSIEILGGGPNGTTPNIRATAEAKLTDPLNSTLSGQISAIEILNSGYGYLSADSPVTISIVGGNGLDAQASALIEQVGEITNDYSTSIDYELQEPISMLLTDDQYEKLVNNDIVWTNSYDPSINSFNDIGKAGLVVLNESKTTLNNLYEGYYVVFTDNSEINPSTDFTAVTAIKAVNSINNTNSLQTFTNVPSSRLSFNLTQAYSAFGGTSLSKIIENYPTSYGFEDKTYDDSLVMLVVRLRTTQYNQDTVTLDYFISEGHAGSLYYKKEIGNQYSGLPESYFLDTVVDKKSSNFKVITNPNIATKGNWVSSNGLPSKKVRVSKNAKNLYSSGVYASDTDEKSKDIGNVPLKLQRILRKIENDDTLNIDIITEAGLGTIWSSAKARHADVDITDNLYIYDELYNVDLAGLDSKDGSTPTGIVYDAYMDVVNQFVVLADKTRKDHIFIADPLRHIFVQGENGKVSRKKNYVFSNDIYWPLKNLFSGIQSSYVCTYGNWIKANDNFTNKQVWLPSSGYAAAVFASTSQQTFPWIAPAGFNRGTLTNVNDIGVNPTQKQRDLLYKININPIVYFTNDGYVMFGQKTLFRKPSAFDRINVRRLFLTLEKETQALLKYFVFEPNTFATRNRLKGALVPTFDKAKLNDGLYDYQLVCDERNNTPDVIDNNELKISIYIKPVRASEFILADFIATRTGIDFSELIG